jgi:phosphatidylserine synthase
MLILILLVLLVIVFLMIPRIPWGEMGSNKFAGQMTMIAVIAVIWYVAHLLGIV